MLTVTRASTFIDFTDLATAQNNLGAPSSDETLLRGYITAASRWAERYIGQTLRLQDYQETIPAFGTQFLQLSRSPIRAITRVLNATATCTAADYTTLVRIEEADAGLLSYDLGFAWTAGMGQDVGDYVMPSMEQRRWLVEYEAGYVLTGATSTSGGTTSTGRTLPEDMEQAVIEKVREWYEARGGVASKHVGEMTINYRSCADDGPAERMLQPFRRYL